MTESPSPEIPARRRPQFSLRTVLLLIVIVAVGASLWVSYGQYRENQRLREENSRLKSERGELTIEPSDKDKLHSISVPCFDEHAWRWRVHVPDGTKFHVELRDQRVLGDEKSSDVRSLPLDPGEHLICVALRRGRSGQWEWLLQQSMPSGRGNEAHTPLLQGLEKLIEIGSKSAWGLIFQTNTVVTEPGKNQQLLHFEMRRPLYEGPASKETSDKIDIVVLDGASAP